MESILNWTYSWGVVRRRPYPCPGDRVSLEIESVMPSIRSSTWLKHCSAFNCRGMLFSGGASDTCTGKPSSGLAERTRLNIWLRLGSVFYREGGQRSREGG
jgi:hypothetical protein